MAQELWEVKDKKIRNLTKEDIDIKAYKANLVKQSKLSCALNGSPVDIVPPGVKDIEKAKLISKNTSKAKANV